MRRFKSSAVVSLVTVACFVVASVAPANHAGAQTRIGSDNSVQVANINQNVNPGAFETKKTLAVDLAEPSELFFRYDLGQSHGCCDDHHEGALKITLDGNEVVSDSVPFANYQFIRCFEDFDFFWDAEVVKGRVAPMSQPASPCQPQIEGPRLDNYKLGGPASVGILAEGHHEAVLQLGDAGWNSVFEVWTAPSTASARIGLSAQLTRLSPMTAISRIYVTEKDKPDVANADRQFTLTVILNNPGIDPKTLIFCPMIHVHNPGDSVQQGQIVAITADGGQRVSGDFLHARSMRFAWPYAAR